MSVAAKFGIWDVDTWLESIPSSLLGDWLEYFELEPQLDFKVFDLHMSQLSAIVVNSSGHASRNLKAADFSLIPPKPKTPEQLLAELDSLGL
ncbi:hypothetical protein L1077_21565 [Pseudoalteromonas luteoviolacea]|uniref:phage tail assembly protein T n=1 Tax=Pseudoalteromonas luteoviolacea TaxID=43657 RepID=UPI001F48003F|nr:hypothetical protein [Pseudoalteromonas luteoviolacea]MCF6442022.1 hypothetical protein [Pseudoalteromonas luteoviolacea]